MEPQWGLSSRLLAEYGSVIQLAESVFLVVVLVVLVVAFFVVVVARHYHHHEENPEKQEVETARNTKNY